MSLPDYLAIYAAILSSLLAIPTLNEIYRNHLSPIKFLCRSFSGMDAKKDENKKALTTHFHLFDITVVNKSKQTIFLSKLSILLKNQKSNLLLAYGSGLINVNFPYRLEPGAQFREYNRLSTLGDNLRAEFLSQIRLFTEFQILVESSVGKTYKSKWYKQKVLYNMEAAVWENIETIDEYNELLGGALE